MGFYEFGQVVCNAVFSVYFRMRVSGLENLPEEGAGFVLISNHQSYLDPVMLGLRLRNRRLTFMAKEELFHVPVLAPIIKKLGAFPVSRGKNSGKAVETAKKVVNENKILALFPEGHRSLNGQLLKPKSGAVVIASQTGAPIVPAAVCYKGKHPFARVYVHFGEMISCGELNVSSDAAPKAVKNATKMVWSRVEEIYRKEREEKD